MGKMMKKQFWLCLFLVTTAWGVSEVEQFETQERLNRLRETLTENMTKQKQEEGGDKFREKKGILDTSLRGSLNGGKTEQEKIEDEAFLKTVEQLLPMNPQQVRKLKEVYEESQAAMASPALVPAKPTSSSLLVDLSPHATPPIIRLGSGYISSLVFLDATGQPWPIDSYSLGDPVSFNVRWDQKGNTLLIQSATFYKSSNLAVILKNLNTPVMITLASGQEAVDYRVDLRIPGNGPNAAPIVNNFELGSTATKELLSVLNGVPAAGLKRVNVKGGVAQAWKMGDNLYLRTKLTILSPAWKAMIRSADGLCAYQLQKTSVILASQEGKDKTVNLILDEIE